MFKVLGHLAYTLLIRQFLDSKTLDALKVSELQKQNRLIKKGKK